MSSNENIIIFKNADIRTMARPARASALAFTEPTTPNSQGIILAVGTNNAVLKKFSARAKEIVDLRGATLVPAFTDSHVHLVEWAQQLSEPNLDGFTSLQSCLAELTNATSKLSAGTWLVGGGWNWNLWTEKREPNRHDLDAIAPNTPIVLKSKDWHTLWCNTAALKAWNIFENPPNIEGGAIDVDSCGVPTGLLRESTAFCFMGKLPKPGCEQKRNNILLAQQRLRSLGITAVHSMESLENYLLLKEMAADGSLTLRVACYILASHLEQLEQTPDLIKSHPVDSVRIAGIKIFTDGSLGSRTAFLLKPYEGTSDRGMSTLNSHDLDSLIRRAEQLNLPCAVHAIGDAANRLALDAIAASRKRGFKKLRHRIEHCQLLSPRDIARFAKWDVIASVQPSHLISDMEMVDIAWGKRRRYAYAFGSLLRSKAKLIFGSDAPVEQPSPIESIYGATTRTHPKTGKNLLPEQECMSTNQSLRALTIEPAKAVGEQSVRGSIEPGKLADFAYLPCLINL